MSKKRIKVFEAGTYPQGEFSSERVKNIFSGITSPVQGIFAHTSKWIAEKKSPVEVGEFSNFSMVGNTVFADVEFNEDGKNFLPILKGVSVEISGDKLTKIAVLPIGVTPAVEGAEFQTNEDGLIFEFEEAKVTIQEIMAALKALDITMLSTAEADELSHAAWKVSDDSYKVEKLKEAGYTVQKEFSKEEIEVIAKAKGLAVVDFQEPVVKTTEEIKAELRAEIEFENKLENIVTDMKSKVPPVMQGVVEFAIRKAGEERTTIVEFSETEKMSRFEKIESDIRGMKKHPTQETYYKDAEFEEKGGTVDHMARAKAETEKLYGGK